MSTNINKVPGNDPIITEFNAKPRVGKLQTLAAARAWGEVLQRRPKCDQRVLNYFETPYGWIIQVDPEPLDDHFKGHTFLAVRPHPIDGWRNGSYHPTYEEALFELIGYRFGQGSNLVPVISLVAKGLRA